MENIDFQLNNIMMIQNQITSNIGEQMQTIGIQMINMGIQMLNKGMQMPGIGNISYMNGQIMGLQAQLMNIGMQINNMGMQMGNMDMGMGMPMNNMNIAMPMNIMDMGMPMNNMDMGMPMNNMDMGMPDNQKKEMNITFNTTQGIKKNIVVDYGTSIDDMLKKYLKEVNHPELIDNNDKIIFLYIANKLKFGDKTKIEDYFKFNHHPLIIVNDISNYIK